MTYDHVQRGLIVETFAITRNESRWYYTSCAEDITVNNVVYKSAIIESGGYSQSTEMSNRGITIEADRSIPFIAPYSAQTVNGIVDVIIGEYNVSKKDHRIKWTGRMLNFAFEKQKCTIKCEPIYTALKRSLNQAKYQKNCPHQLYGNPPSDVMGCRASRTAFTTRHPVQNVSGFNLTLGGAINQTANFYAGGIVTANVNDETHEYFVVSSNGNVIELDNRAPQSLVGGIVSLCPGCDHTMQTCNDKFGQILNYGGVPYVPEKNPMGGSPIF